MKYIALVLLGLLIAGPAGAAWDYMTVEGADDVPLHVVTAGSRDKPAILFIHGIGQSHYSFHRQLDSDLADDFFLVAFDLRGHGASGKPWTSDAYDNVTVWAQDVAAVIDATQARRPVLVAWSYGTLVAMDFMREFGVADIAGVNLTGAIGALRPFRMPETDDPAMEEFARIRELQLSPDLVDNIRAGELMVPWLTAHPIPETERQRFQSIALMFPAYARRAMMSRQLDNQDMVARLRLPILFSLGQEDNPAQLEDAADIVATHDNMSLSVYDGVGHSVFFEEPARFNAELREFASRVQAGADSHQVMQH